MTYISHKNIPENTIESRSYQVNIAKTALSGNTLVVLPTGMGKTAVALLVAAERIDIGKILMLAPTKPLVEQHLRYFTQNLLLKPEDIVMFTGEIPSEKRVLLWKKSRFVVATPEVIRNDIENGLYNLSDVSLLVVDECHHAVGDYAYTGITENYNQTALHPLVLGMTASPGHDKQRVAEICDHLSIKQTEIRTTDDEDVLPYVHDREIDTVLLDLPEELWLSVSAFNSILDDCLDQLGNMHYKVPKREMLSQKGMNMVMAQIQERKNSGDKSSFTAMSIYGKIMKIRHGILLAGTQGAIALKVYLQRLVTEAADKKGTKASKQIVADERFQKVLAMSEKWAAEIHPKAAMVARLIQEQMIESPESRIIVFGTYRDTVNMLVDYLNGMGIAAQRFVGQASREEEKGLSQKKQIEAIQKFKDGEFQVLVATSVGEEGLDIPSTDMVIFYEPPPSDVRSIQRKGRTGRNSTGKVVILVTKGTVDETFRWVSDTKEKKMIRSVTRMKNTGAVPTNQVLTTPDPIPAAGEEKYAPTTQMTLADVVLSGEESQGPIIKVDTREKDSGVVSALKRMGASVVVAPIPAGRYAISRKVVADYFTLDTFADFLINDDISSRFSVLKDFALSPFIIIEGGSMSDLSGKQNLSENVIRNSLAKITLEFAIPVFFTRNEEETAGLLLTFSRRCEDEEIISHDKKESVTVSVLASIPLITPQKAEFLLKEFGSLKGVFAASKDELLNVDGIDEDAVSSLLSHSLYRWNNVR